MTWSYLQGYGMVMTTYLVRASNGVLLRLAGVFWRSGLSGRQPNVLAKLEESFAGDGAEQVSHSYMLLAPTRRRVLPWPLTNGYRHGHPAHEGCMRQRALQRLKNEFRPGVGQKALHNHDCRVGGRVYLPSGDLGVTHSIVLHKQTVSTSATAELVEE